MQNIFRILKDIWLPVSKRINGTFCLKKGKDEWMQSVIFMTPEAGSVDKTDVCFHRLNFI